jgi:D-arabinose 1-dehydrogenase-like Zn-dependent alcohol dehydrogenase
MSRKPCAHGRWSEKDTPKWHSNTPPLHPFPAISRMAKYSSKSELPHSIQCAYSTSSPASVCRAITYSGYTLMGLMPNFVAGRPFTAAEYDISGTVIASAFLDIDQQQRTKQGALAEYTRFPAECLMPRPEKISAIDASGVALVAQTAYMCLVDLARVKQGQIVFVNGGSSAVGMFGIQIAKAKGAKVWASASGKNETFVRGLGVEQVRCWSKAYSHLLILPCSFSITQMSLYTLHWSGRHESGI